MLVSNLNLQELLAAVSACLQRVIPHDVAGKIGGAVDLLTRKEKVIIEASKKKGFSFAVLEKALKQSADIH